LGGQPSHSLHIVKQFGEAGLGPCPCNANGANGQVHRPFLAGEEVLNCDAHRRFASTGPSGEERHWLVPEFLEQDLRTQEAASEELLIGPGAIGDIGPGLAGNVVRVDQLKQQGAVVPCRIDYPRTRD
jgi:hypothetical protein